MAVSPLTRASILWSAKGSGATVTHPDAGGTTSGTTVLVVTQSNGPSTISGFTLDLSEEIDGSFRLRHFRKSSVSAGETSWTITINGQYVQWVMLEVSGLAASPVVMPSEVGVTTFGGDSANVSTAFSTNSPVTAYNDVLYLAAWSLRTNKDPATLPNLTLTPTMSSGFHWTSLQDQRWTNDPSTGDDQLLHVGVGFPFPDNALANFRAVFSGHDDLDNTDLWMASHVGYRSAESTKVNPLELCYGFEQGTYGGLATGAAAAYRIVSSVLGTLNTDILVQGASARTGSYGCRVIQAAAAKYVRVDNTKFPTGLTVFTPSFGVKVVSSTGTVVLAEINPSAGTIAQLVYDTTTTKLGVRWGSGGTPAYQSGTTPAGTFVWVDWQTSGYGGTTRTMRWSCEQNGQMRVQDSPADLTGQTASNIASFNWGGNVAQTVTLDVDDVCIAHTELGHYPIGRTKVLGYGINPAGTATVSLAGSFNVFTANGTLAAWNATNARNAIDEIPPVVSTASDGVVQITAGTQEAQFPLLAPSYNTGDIPIGMCAMVPMWANSTASANVQLRGVSMILPATVTVTQGNAAQPVSATVPLWAHSRDTYGPAQVTAAVINAGVFGIGNSTDATPDIGAHSFIGELAVKERLTSRVVALEGGAFYVDAILNAMSSAVVSLTAVAPAGTRGATLRWTVDGVPDSEYVEAGTSHTETLNAPTWDAVSNIELEPDADAA